MLEALDNLIRDIVNTEYHDDVDEIERLTKELRGCVANRARLVTCMRELDSVSADICNIATRMRIDTVDAAVDVAVDAAIPHAGFWQQQERKRGCNCREAK